MATLYSQQSANVRKTWFLLLLVFVLLIAIGWVLAQIYQTPAILYGAVALSLILNIWSYWQADKVALAVSRAVPADPVQFRELHHVVENLAITAGLPKPRVYIINDPALNAFATGRDAAHAAVAVTTGLLERLNKTELEGVLAHELSHIKNRDILLSTVVVVLVGVIAIISDWFLRSRLWGIGRSDEREGQAGAIFMIIGLVLLIVSPIIAMLIQLAISRKREFLADASGALLTRYPEGLASALEKIGAYQLPLKSASHATAHLFISNPFGARGEQGWHRLFLTHPPIVERVKILRQM